jgi:uncharacterized membrane protein YccC
MLFTAAPAADATRPGLAAPHAWEPPVLTLLAPALARLLHHIGSSTLGRAVDRAVLASRAAGRVPGLRTAKTTTAAVLAFLAADALTSTPGPVLAPLTALLVVQLTTYETLTSGLERVVSVLAGVLVAVGLATVVGLNWWSLGLAVGSSLVIGMLLRLGPNLLEVPISAMIVLAVGGGAQQAEGRVVETLIGAAVGVAVNLLVAPPLHVRPASDALAGLADAMAAVVRGLADDLRDGWSREAADRWLDEARGLARVVARADHTLARAEQSGRFNPRGSVARAAQPRLRTGLSGLEHGYVVLRSLCRALLDRAYYVPVGEQAYSAPAREALARALDEVADAMTAVGVHTAAAVDDGEARTRLLEILERLRQRRDRLSRLLLVDPAHDEAAWQQHGALLAGVDRLRVELAAAVAPPLQPWPSRAVLPRQRRGLRRSLVLRS